MKKNVNIKKLNNLFDALEEESSVNKASVIENLEDYGIHSKSLLKNGLKELSKIQKEVGSLKNKTDRNSNANSYDLNDNWSISDELQDLPIAAFIADKDTDLINEELLEEKKKKKST